MFVAPCRFCVGPVVFHAVSWVWMISTGDAVLFAWEVAVEPCHLVSHGAKRRAAATHLSRGARFGWWHLAGRCLLFEVQMFWEQRDSAALMLKNWLSVTLQGQYLTCLGVQMLVVTPSFLSVPKIWRNDTICSLASIICHWS